jgi:tRNA dimethylallyltransferase
MRETVEEDSRPPVVIVTGPTASGKTAIGIRLARRFGGEILNADSMQVYRYLDIGTAKPTLAQRAEVPHHLIDIAAPDVQYNAGLYSRDARRAASSVFRRGRAVFLTGGTGLYIRAFLEGLIEGGGGDPDRRKALEEEHRSAVAAGEPRRLHERLASLDPESGARIHPNDLIRIIRALEMIEATGRPVSELRRSQRSRGDRYRTLRLAIDPGPERLKARIDDRFVQMVEAGLLQEVRNLRERGYGPELPCMRAIVYRHMQPVIDGADTMANVLAEMQRDTRHFARRQRTWLRSLRDAVWMHPDDEDGLQKAVERFLRVSSPTTCS